MKRKINIKRLKAKIARQLLSNPKVLRKLERKYGRRTIRALSTDNCNDFAADCCNCCPGQTVDCCPNQISENLTATITSGFNCSCAVGQTIDLTWDGSKWVGSGTICDDSLSLEFSCPPGSDGPEDFILGWSGDCGTSDSPVNSGSPTCEDPFLVEFGSLGMTSPCCDGDSGGQIDIEITETSL